MCGICGIINFNKNNVREESIKTMMSKIKHRGPDDDGLFIDANSGFGFVRLSILDLSQLGHQPMFDETQRFMIIHNGEVYNYIELRNELIRNGYNFISNTDTEVILKSYMHWGKECLQKFNGMWAFVIYDSLTKEVFGSRDRYGIKPFYYYIDKNIFVFASDIPPIQVTLRTSLGINYKTVYDYFVFGRTDHNEDTFFDGIKKLHHGHCFIISNNNFRLEKWYKLKINIKSHKNPLEEFQYLLEDSIKLRLRSDVPLGVCLSGGLDSSSIVCLLNKRLNYNELNTFSAIYNKGDRADESDYINTLAHYANKMNFIKPDLQSFLDDIEDLISAHSEPFSTTAIYAQYKVMQLAKSNVKVLLDGQGADEHLAGYHYFYGFYLKELFKSLLLRKLFAEGYGAVRKTNSFYGMSTTFYFMLPSVISEKILVSKKKFLSKDFSNEYEGSDISRFLYSSKNLNESLLNHFEYKLEHLLKWEDRNSMWFSIESRVPFLDYRLVEFVFSLPSKQKINKGSTKYILRQTMKGIVPDKILNRNDKIGFSTPEDKWIWTKNFRDIYKNIFDEMLNENRAICKEIFNFNGEPDPTSFLNRNSSDIWRIFNFLMWLKHYINRK